MFKKGQSGNPKGRPARAVEERNLEALAKAYSLDDEIVTWQTFSALAKAGSIDHAKYLDERKHGKLIDRSEVKTGAIPIEVELDPGDDSDSPAEDSPNEAAE